jgi:hypothetical protein
MIDEVLGEALHNPNSIPANYLHQTHFSLLVDDLKQEDVTALLFDDYILLKVKVKFVLFRKYRKRNATRLGLISISSFRCCGKTPKKIRF